MDVQVFEGCMGAKGLFYYCDASLGDPWASGPGYSSKAAAIAAAEEQGHVVVDMDETAK